MIYPSNIFTPEPSTKNLRPFIIFIPQEVNFNVGKSLLYGNTLDMLEPKTPFVLPMADGGLVDSSTNEYSSQSALMGTIANKMGEAVNSYASKTGLQNASALVGRLPDPKLTQVYMGTSQRSFTGTWQIVPQSVGEAAAAMAILAYVKYCAAPDQSSSAKIGVLLQPYVFRIIFSNPLIQLAMQMDQMAIESYSINYFAQGYASTYANGSMPKHMELTMTFKEYGIKTKKDWLPYNGEKKWN